MANALPVHEIHAHENLSHEVLDVMHGDQFAVFLCVLDDLLQVLRAEFEDKVLHNFSFLVLRIVDVQELDHVLAASQPIQHFKLTGYILSTLARPLDRHRFHRMRVDRLKNVTCTYQATELVNQQFTANEQTNKRARIDTYIYSR